MQLLIFLCRVVLGSVCVNAQMLDVTHEYLRVYLEKKPTILLMVVHTNYKQFQSHKHLV